jgi:hypothetical protein
MSAASAVPKQERSMTDDAMSPDLAAEWRAVITEHLHEAMVPVWSLPPGLLMRRDRDGLMVLDRHGTELVLIPWDRLPGA